MGSSHKARSDEEGRSRDATCTAGSGRGDETAVNVGDAERAISAVVGGCALLYGLSKLSLSGIVAAVAGGALIYRGVSGHCSMYEALDMSTACDSGNSGRPRRGMRHGVTEASLAATGESPSNLP